MKIKKNYSMLGSTISTDRPTIIAQDLRFTEDMLYVLLQDGREIGVPLVWYPSLHDATPAQRNNHRFIGKGIGIHWPDIDEDILVERLVKG